MSRFATVLLLLAALPGAGAAQSDPPDPSAPLVLHLPGGTRALGVGDAWAAGRGAEVLFYNPAQIGVLRGTTISAQRFGDAATLGTLSTVGPFGRIWIGAGMQYLDYHAEPATGFYTDPAGLTSRGPVHAASMAATVAAAFRFKGVRFGVGAKYVEERVGAARDNGAAFDVGAAREVGRTTVALAVQNLGGDLEVLGQEAELPTRVTLGVASPTIRVSTFFDATIALAVSREQDGRIVPAGGAELFYEPVGGWYFVARAGARRVRSEPGRAEAPVTFGGSFGLDRFWLDYAFQPYKGPGAAHRLGIRIQ
jgi:hypothetical protein